MLEQAGVKPGTKFTFSYNTSEYHKKMAIFAQSEWKTKLGLDMEMEAMEFKVLLKKRHDGTFEMARNGWLADYNDATSFLALVRCDSDQNNNFNCNRKAEELINQGTQQTDPAKRKALLTQATDLIMEDYPIIPLLQYSLPRLVKHRDEIREMLAKNVVIRHVPLLAFVLFAFVVYYNLLNLSQSWMISGRLSLWQVMLGLHGSVLALAVGWLLKRHHNWAWRDLLPAPRRSLKGAA